MKTLVATLALTLASLYLGFFFGVRSHASITYTLERLAEQSSLLGYIQEGLILYDYKHSKKILYTFKEIVPIDEDLKVVTLEEARRNL